VTEETERDLAQPVLVGRDPELDALRLFVARCASSGGAMLMTGDPGVGKTALLGAVSAAAARSGIRVLHAAGVQFEADMSFAGLSQVVLPLADGLGGLEAIHEAALSVALGLGVGPAAERLVVATALLSLLDRAAARQPLLVIIDDLQWIDRASATVLGMVARRLTGTRVALLAAQRIYDESLFERVGLPTMVVGPLSDASSACLVTGAYPAMAPAVRDRLVLDAGGIPLALLELPRQLSSAQLLAQETLPTTLPLSRHLQLVFAARIASQPEPTRRVLLLAALDGSGDLRVTHPCWGDAGDDGADHLAPAERAGLVWVDPTAQRLTFSHPLVRAAVVAVATAGQRRAAHRALAELFTDDPDLCTWHLTEAALGPDEQVAAQVEAAAYRVLQRGDAVAAVRSLVRAAELSPAGPDRSRRLSEAAYVGASDFGAMASGITLLRQAHDADPDQQDALSPAVAAAFLMVNSNATIDTAHRLLVAALDAHPAGHSDHVVEEAFHTLSVVCWNGSRPEWWDASRAALERHGAALPPLLRIMLTTVADPARVSAEDLRQIDGAVADLPLHPDFVHVQRVFFAATYVDRVDGCRQALQQVIDEGAADDGSVPAISAMVFVSLAEFITGRWEESRRHVDRGVQLAERLGYTMLRWAGWYVQALLAATTGEHARAEEILAQMGQWALPRGVLVVKSYMAHVAALAALGRGDYENAFHSCAAISPPGTFPAYQPFALWVVLDLVEAAERSGRHDAAVAHVRAAQAAGIPAISSRLALHCAAGAALVAASDQAGAMFEQALATPDAESWPFDLARVELAYGEHLRRQRSTTSARHHLAAAVAAFDELGARPWCDRAKAELQATGQTRHSLGASDPLALTPQEREIALLAATGRTNRQIGEQLYLSPRTVGAHLYRVFPKLSVTSRAGLRDALSALPPPAPPSSD
jgi:DNA-binding CsgD family transcriptional regulator